ncbi:hypothetical protein ABRP86_03260 [Corynebacterium sp. KPL3927]
MKEAIVFSSEFNGAANGVVEAVHAVVEPFINIADGASQLIGMFV